MTGKGLKMLYHNLRLLGNVMGVKTHKAGQRFRCFLFIDFGIILNSFDDSVVGFICGIVLQNIEDKTFLNGLAHTIEMERTGFTIRSLCPEQLYSYLSR